MTTQRTWKDEIRKRIHGCPRDLKKALKAERDQLVKVQGERSDGQDIDIEAAQAACKAFDAALRDHKGSLQHIQNIKR